jgi:hypothetical protein
MRYGTVKHIVKLSADMPPFLSQDRPKKVKEIYRALKREHPEYSAGKKARIANAMGKEAEVEYRGKKFPGYNQPIDSDRPEKKKMVLAKKGDQVKLIHFGQKGYKHNYSDAAKKNYLTRSAGIRGKDGSLTANDKFSANYWARRELWPKNEPADGSARNREKRASVLTAAMIAGLPVAGFAAFMASLPESSRKRLAAEIRDPRLYSNLRGGVTGEDAKERIAAHKHLRKDTTGILSAMHAGFTREKRASNDTQEDSRRITPARALGTLGITNALLGVGSGIGLGTLIEMPGGVRELLSKKTPEGEAELKDLLRKTNVRVVEGVPTFEDAKKTVDAIPIMNRMPSEIKKEQAEGMLINLKNAGPHFNTMTDTVFLNNVRNPDVLAHELGHATGSFGKFLLQRGQIPGKIVAPFLGLGALIQGGRATQAEGQEAEQRLVQARNLGIAGAAAGWAPTLLEEARATGRATMEAAPGLRGKRLKALLPAYGTYLAQALPSATIPLSAEILRRRVVSRDNEREKRASDDDFGHKAELAGLGILAAPYAAHLGAKVPGLRKAAKPVSDFLHDSPSVEHAMELGGLGVLATPSLKHYMNKRKEAKNN